MNKQTAKKITDNKLARFGAILVLGLVAALIIITRQTSAEADRVVYEFYETTRQTSEFGGWAALSLSQLTAVEKKMAAKELLERLYEEDHVIHELPWTHRWSFNRQFRARIFDMGD